MSEVYECLNLGDVHLDKLGRLLGERQFDLQIGELHKPMQYALSKGIRHVNFLGDVSEHPYLSVTAFCKLLRFLKAYDDKLNITFILGNHDFAENGVHSLLPFIQMQELKMFNTVKFYTAPKVVKFGDVKVNYSPYPFTDGIKKAVNLGHFEVSGSTRDNGRIIKEAHDVGNIDWDMGHLHTPHDVGSVHYVGTLYQTNFGESLPKSFTHAKYRMSGGKLQHKRVRVPNDPKFKLFNLKVESKSDLKEIHKNENYLYKLFVQSKYDISAKDLEKYPNIIDVKGFTTKEELTALMDEEFIEMREQNLVLPSATENLRDFLKSKGVEKKQINRAMEITKELLKRGEKK